MTDAVYDGDWRLFSHDPITGKKVWHLDMGTHIIVRTDTPVDALFDQNAEDLNNSIGQRWNDGRRVASIPLDVYYKHLGEAARGGDQEYIKRWLNDSDNAKFRTFGGRL